MLVGLDFDNTLVCYDEVFHAEALELGLIPASLPRLKNAVRDHIRETAGDLAWQKLQALVYAHRMRQARLKPGAEDFLRRCRERGLGLVVVSHKSETAPMDPEQASLRQASLDFMRAAGFFDAYPQGLGFCPEDIHFESTRSEKVARINSLGCRFFIDDLPEVLCHPDLAPAVRRVLFSAGVPADGSIELSGLWPEIARHVLG